ncbi:MAG: TetR/AcrR family transcriptional regulator [Desulfobulbus sp.]|jgi:AcrR family transcriptional regulator|uniref:TetR/AcrR family transcriptional regulator n=1 Tax=Desulfobulbus sp. TaxID=895 RepID=UPI002851AA3D|nr:TetR/AcrR family transcriptional regulator [Desulfobulbus sp.]MDR2551151.1 TetR/AcrR family transcriptional regulator [Desulfobulbus sp.]
MKKKDVILRAATHLFSRKGYKDTAMGELTKMTGAAEGTIFYHFKSKQGLFLAILSNLKESILPEFEQYRKVESEKTGLDTVEESIAFYLHMAESREDLFAILHQRYPYELAENNPECRDHLEAVYNCFVDIFENAIVAGQRDGSIAADLAARKSALIVFSMVDSMVRFRMNNLYNVGALYKDLIESCRRMLENRNR